MDADETAEPLPGLTLMPEHGVDVPVWHGPDSENIGNVGAEELLVMGVSSRRSSGGVPTGAESTVRLARRLQAELRGYRIFLAAHTDPRPVDEWGG